jgi:hypothetical protein
MTLLKTLNKRIATPQTRDLTCFRIGVGSTRPSVGHEVVRQRTVHGTAFFMHYSDYFEK